MASRPIISKGGSFSVCVGVLYAKESFASRGDLVNLVDTVSRSIHFEPCESTV